MVACASAVGSYRADDSFELLFANSIPSLHPSIPSGSHQSANIPHCWNRSALYIAMSLFIETTRSDHMTCPAAFGTTKFMHALTPSEIDGRGACGCGCD